MNSAEILKSTEMDNFSQNMLSSDTDLLNKVKQVIELTGCSNDIAVTTLYDSNYNIEIAIDKIFEQTQRTLVGESNKMSSDWKEVAKYKKKPSLEICQSDLNIDVKEIVENKIIVDKSKPIRGNVRGRCRFSQNSNRSYENNKQPSNGTDEAYESYVNRNSVSRGRGRRSQYRLNSNRGRTKHNTNQENVYDEHIDGDSERHLSGESNKWNLSYDPCNDWIIENNSKSNDFIESDKTSDNNYDDVPHHNPDSALKIDKFEANLIESCIESVKNDVVLKDDPKTNQLNPLDLVAKCSNKVDIFGGFSRTKPPAPSSRVPLEPVKLLTSAGVVSMPAKTGFNFGLNFNEYSQSTMKSIDASAESFMSKMILNQPYDGVVSKNKTTKSALSIMNVTDNRSDDYLQSNFSETESPLASIVTPANVRMSADKSANKPKSDLKSGDIFSSSINQRHIDLSEKKLMNDGGNGTNYKINDCVSNNHQSLNTTLLSSSPQLCPPPGMSNAHLIQQFQNNPQYLSLLNIPNGSSIFSGCNINQMNDLSDVGPSDEQSFMHAESNKDFNSKSSNSKHNICSIPNSNQQVLLPKVSDSENAGTHSSAILSAMTVSNLCCFPQVYMNNYGSFMPTVAGHTSSQATEVTQSQIPNKPIYNIPIPHRNYQLSDDFDDLIQNKKFQRPQNFVQNFSKSHDDTLEVDKSTKLANNAQINRQSSQSQNVSSSNRSTNQHQVQQQPPVSNDPRYLAFHHQHSNHSYQNNMFNCVTATGAHPTAHPYAMAHQGGGLQQLHPHLQLMQQQMHNFPQSYQFQEHMMTSMVSNPSSRSNISQGSGSSGNQSRTNRPGNQLWHP